MLSPLPPTKTSSQLSPFSELERDPTSSRAVLLNAEHEPAFRRAAFQNVKNQADPAVPGFEKYMGKKDVMSYARELSGASEDAGYSYINRLFALVVGPLIEVREEFKKGHFQKTCIFRKSSDALLTLDELEAKYPKGGRSQ